MLASIVADLTDQLEEFSANWWFLFVIMIIALLDSVLPVVPGETMVIIGGVAAGQGNQWLPLVILAGAGGAFLGDNLAYLIGRKFSGRVERWAEAKQKRRDRLDAATRQIHVRGGLLLITARFIPGGRTLLTISSGLTNQPWPWFAKWIAIATTIWASYAALLGYFFGQAFEDDHAVAFWLAFGTALAVTGLLELVRWLRSLGFSTGV
jgi:membrane protein DedA with SNARE-associated domain